MQELNNYLHRNYAVMVDKQKGRVGQFSTFTKNDGEYNVSVLLSCFDDNELEEVQVSLKKGMDRWTSRLLPKDFAKAKELRLDIDEVFKVTVDRLKSEFQEQSGNELVDRFGGREKVKEATKTKAIDDVYCWELERWVTHPYWVANLKDNHTGVTLRELAIAAKV
ncbi:hypothetical protein [Acinetobacter sp. GN11]